MNSKQQLLCVQEKSGPAAAVRDGKALWKIPGGLVDPGEDLAASATREVREETGIETTFISVAGIVEGHSGPSPTRDNASDLYAMCVLQVVDEEQPIVPQAEEIAACRWMDVADVFSQRLLSTKTAFGHAHRAAIEIARGERQGLQFETLPTRYNKANIFTTSGLIVAKE